MPKLRDILLELRDEDVNLTELGYSNGELRKLLGEEAADEDDLPEPPEETLTKAGDLWVLGEHRLLCGISEDSEAVTVLTEGRQVDHVFGGPPCFNQKNLGCWNSYGAYLETMHQIMVAMHLFFCKFCSVR